RSMVVVSCGSCVCRSPLAPATPAATTIIARQPRSARILLRMVVGIMYGPSVPRSRTEAREIRYFMMTNTGVSRAEAREKGDARVLLVEDDHELREALAENLRLNGIDVM